MTDLAALLHTLTLKRERDESRDEWDAEMRARKRVDEEEEDDGGSTSPGQ